MNDTWLVISSRLGLYRANNYDSYHISLVHLDHKLAGDRLARANMVRSAEPTSTSDACKLTT